MRQHTLFFVLLALVALVAFPGCFGGGDDNGNGNGNGGGHSVIKIGFAGPLTGPGKDFGEQAQMGAQLFVDLYNVKGGLNGKKVALVVKDDLGKPENSQLSAKELASDPAILGVAANLNSRCTIAAANVFNKAGVPQVTYGSTNPTICKENRPYTFRNIYTDDDAGRMLADFSKNELKKTKVAVYYENDAYGKGLRDFYVQRAKEIGLDVVFDKSYDSPSNPDYRSELKGCMDKNPELLFISGSDAPTSTIANFAKELKPDIQLLSGDGSYLQSFIDLSLQNAEGAIVSGPADFSKGDTPEVREFVTEFKKKYGKEPSVWAFQAYDAVGLLLHAAKNAGEDREKIAKYMADMTTPEKGYTGVTGNTYFNQHGDPVGKIMSFFIVRNQKFELFK